MPLKIAQVAISLQIKALHQIIEQHLPASPFIVGEELANHIHQYSREHKLGYYPALEYFQDKSIEKDLLDAAEGISWVVNNLIREELQNRLRPVFSSISFESIQNIAFTMPQIRPGGSNDIHKLAAHYTPDHVKVNMIASLVRKEISPDGAEQYSRIMLKRWLNERFADMKITCITSLDRDAIS